MICRNCRADVRLDDMVIVIEDEPGTTISFKVYKCPVCKTNLAVFPIDPKNKLTDKPESSET